MKKLLSLLLATALLVACGGEKKKELTVEEQAKVYCEQLYKAMEAGDMEKGMALAEEVEKWYESLSEEDKAKADAASAEFEAEMIGEEYEDEDDLGCGGYEMTVGETADYYATQLLDALDNADSGAFAAAMEESDAWYESLDERDQQVADGIMAEYEAEMIEALAEVADDPDFAALFAE